MGKNYTQAKREKWLDIVKAVAVSAVVFHHAGFPVLFLNMIFVSVFFVTSGYVFKEQSFKSYIVKQIKRLWIPFVISNIIILLGHNLLCAIGLWEGSPYEIGAFCELTARSLLFVEADSLCAPQWFVFMIFSANLAFYILYYLTKFIARLMGDGEEQKKVAGLITIRDAILLAECVILYIIGLVFADRLNQIMWGNSAFLTNVMFGMILFYIGFISRKYNLPAKLLQLNKIVLISMFVVATGILGIMYYMGYIADHRAGYFSHSYLLPVITLIGAIWLLLLSKGIIEKIPFVRDIVGYVGENSLYVMLFHGLAFQVITFIQVKICHIPYDSGWIWQNIYMGSGLWVVSAGLVGTLLPVACRYIYLRVVKAVRDR